MGRISSQCSGERRNRIILINHSFADCEEGICRINGLAAGGIPFLFIIDFDLYNWKVIPLSEIDNEKILFNLNGSGNSNEYTSTKKNLIFKKFPVGYYLYRKAFDTVMANLYAGNSYLLNLTFPTRIETNYSLKEIFGASRAKYKLYYDEKFVVFSPETFIRIDNDMIYSFPMKGTISEKVENAAEVILNDPKESAEHATIVDLIRNDLSIVSKNVKVEAYRYIERINTHEQTLLQVSSRISGRLPGNYTETLGDLLFKLLPAGSVTGAPKRKTVEIIKNAEISPRGYYTGIFGIFDGRNLDSAVMIRFIEKFDGEYYFRSGGGITHMSNPESEYQELIDKVYVPIIRNDKG